MPYAGKEPIVTSPTVSVPSANQEAISTLNSAGVDLSGVPKNSVITGAAKTDTGYNVTYYTPDELQQIETYNTEVRQNNILNLRLKEFGYNQMPYGGRVTVVSPIQALASVAANNPSQVGAAANVFYQKGKATIYQNQQEFDVVPQPSVLSTESAKPLLHLNTDLSLGGLLSNPVGYFEDYLNITTLATSKAKDPLSNVVGFETGMAGIQFNMAYGAVNPILKLTGQKTFDNPWIGPQNKIQEYGTYAGQIFDIATITALAPELLPVSVPAILGAGALNVAIGQGMRFLPTNPLTGKQQGNFGSPNDVLNEFITGEGFYVGTEGLMGGLSNFAASSMTPAGRIAAQLAWTSSGRITLFTGVGAGMGYVTTGTALGAGEGALLGFGSSVTGEVLNTYLRPRLPQLKVENINFRANPTGSLGLPEDTDAIYYGWGIKGKALVAYMPNEIEPRIIGGYISTDPIDFEAPPSSGFKVPFGDTKLFLGTPTVDPSVYSYGMGDLAAAEAPAFKSPLDVKIYQKGLNTYGPELEQENFALGKDLIYTAQKANIPSEMIPENLVIEAKTDPFIGQAVSNVMTNPEFKDIGEYFGSSSFRSVTGQGRIGADVDVSGVPNETELARFGNAITEQANIISNTRNYVFKEGDIFNIATNTRLTDIHLESDFPTAPKPDKLIPGLSKPKQPISDSGKGVTFGLGSKDPLNIEDVNVMDPTETVVRKGSSALTPFKYDLRPEPESEYSRELSQTEDAAAISRLKVEQPKFLDYLKSQDEEGFYGTSPRVLHGRSKDVTDFLAESNILNNVLYGGSKTSAIDRLTEIYVEKGLTTPEKVQAAINENPDVFGIEENMAGLLPEAPAPLNPSRFPSFAAFPKQAPEPYGYEPDTSFIPRKQQYNPISYRNTPPPRSASVFGYPTYDFSSSPTYMSPLISSYPSLFSTQPFSSSFASLPSPRKSPSIPSPYSYNIPRLPSPYPSTTRKSPPDKQNEDENYPFTVGPIDTKKPKRKIRSPPSPFLTRKQIYPILVGKDVLKI